MSNEKHRHTVWLTDEAWAEVQRHYKEDNCTKQNEFIEKAIQFYCGYLDTEKVGAYLPRILSELLESKLDVLASRLNKQQFKMAVNVGLMATILAMGMEVSPDDIKRIRVQCIRETKETNGQLSLEDAMEKYREDG